MCIDAPWLQDVFVYGTLMLKKKNLTPGRALALAKYIGFLLPLWLRMATLMNQWIDKLHLTFHCSIVFQGAELFFRLPPLH